MANASRFSSYRAYALLSAVVLALLFTWALPVGAQDAAAPAPAPAPKFTAGFARIDVTPAVGAEIPGGFAQNISKGIHDPLWAEVAYLSDGTTELAIVGLDLIMIQGDTVEATRAQAEKRCGIPAGNILIAASHTHNGGPINDCFGDTRDPEYCNIVAGKIAEAIGEAHDKAVEAHIGIGLGHEDSVAFNRRFRMKDGTIKTHPGKMNPDIVEPAGPIDPGVGVIALEDTAGKPLGCIVNYTCHGTTLGGSLFSADWIGYLRSTVRGAIGPDTGVVFLNGACGDVTQVDNRSPRPSEFGEGWARRVGMTVGAEALKVLARMEFQPEAILSVASQTLDLPIRDLAGSDEELVAREAPATGLGSNGDKVYLREAAFVRAMKEKSPTVKAEIQVMRIGDAAIASNPAEYFCQLGLNIKQGSPWKLTMVSELSNGCTGYCPTAEAFKGGGYEVRTARSSFLAPGCGEQIVDASVKLLNQLAGK